MAGMVNAQNRNSATVTQLALELWVESRVSDVTTKKYRTSAFQRTINELLTPSELGDMTSQTSPQNRKFEEITTLEQVSVVMTKWIL